MTITSTAVETYPTLRGATFTCDKVSVSVCVHTDGRWTVCVENSSHAAYRGMGKRFASYDDAVEGYKNAKVKAILSAARDALAV
jgi:hypothetical protein